MHVHGYIQESGKNDPTERTSHLTCACALFLMRNWRLRPVLFFVAFIDGTKGRDDVVFGLDGPRPDCRVHRQQACKSKRRGHPARHPVRDCGRFCRRLAVPHLWRSWRTRTRPLQSRGGGDGLSGFPGPLSRPETKKSLVARLPLHRLARLWEWLLWARRPAAPRRPILYFASGLRPAARTAGSKTGAVGASWGGSVA